MKKILTLLSVALLLIVACAQQAPKEEQATVSSQITPVEPPQAEPPVYEEEKSAEESVVTTQGETAIVKEKAKEEKASPKKETVNIEVTASQWQFDPNTITVKKGSHVVLTLVSKDVDHGLGIAAYGVKEKIPAGRAVDVEFDADKAGEFPFYCTVYCGTGHSSMKGKLVVTE